MIKMLSLLDIKKYYIIMYSELRNYIWDFNTVKHLADLEIAVYRRFPDVAEIRSRFGSFFSCINRICEEDEDLDAAVQNFKDLIYSSDVFYSRIVKPKEV